MARLRLLAEEETREAEATVVEERDPHAVRLLTVHAAKGLEFPVVILPECAAPAYKSGAERVLLDPDLGLAVKARAADGKRRFGVHGASVDARRCERGLAESRRLLYVAVTRARDLVILSGRAAQRQESWRLWVDEVREEAVQRGLLRVVREVEAPDAPACLTAPVDPEHFGELGPAAHADVARIEAFPAAAAAHGLGAGDATGGCRCTARAGTSSSTSCGSKSGPRRSTRCPIPLGAEPGAPASALGTLAHRLLELVPLQLSPAQTPPRVGAPPRAGG